MVHPAGCILGPSLRLSCILGVLAPGSGLLEGGKWFFFGSSLGSGGSWRRGLDSQKEQKHKMVLLWFPTRFRGVWRRVLG